MKIAYSADEIKSELLDHINEDAELKKVLKANLNVVGKIRAIIEATGRIIADYIFDLILSVYNNIFIYNADEEALINHLKDRGLSEWKQAMYATGIVRVGSTVLPTTERKISQLAIVGTEGDNSEDVKQFILLNGGTVSSSTPVDDRGFYTIEISIKSVQAGAKFNVPEDSITQFITNIPGIDVVYNPDQTAYGRDKETLDEVRERIATRDNAIYHGMLSWFVSETQNFSFVTDAVGIPRYDGRGTVGIAFLTPSGLPTQEQIDEVQDYFNTDQQDPAGAWKVVVFLMSSKVWDAAITVYYTGEDAPADTELEDALDIYFEQLARGEDIISDQIDSIIIVNVEGIKSVSITSHSGYVVNEYEFPVKGTITWTKVPYAE